MESRDARPTVDGLMSIALIGATSILPADLVPMAFLGVGEGVMIVPLDVFKDALSVRKALCYVAQEKGAHCLVFINETWGARLPDDDPDSARIKAGELRIRDLPPEKRYDGMAIYGEEQGRYLVRSYMLDADRRLIPLEGGNGFVLSSDDPQANTSFYPILACNGARLTPIKVP